MQNKNDTLLNNILNDKEIQPSSNLANHHQKFFKTKPGKYGEGDKFIGFTVQ